MTVQLEAISGFERRTAGWIVQTFWLRDRRGGPWDPPAHLDWEPVSFPGNTGARLKGRYFHAKEPRGVVVAAHPDKRYAGHWFVRSGWVDRLTEAGLDVLTFDLTGYGQSHGPATYYAEDLHGAIRYVKIRDPQTPIHVFGVSLGAFAAAVASPWMDDIGGLVLESPYPSITDWYGRGLGALASKTFDTIFRKTARFIRAETRIRDARPDRILIAASAADHVTPSPLTRRMAGAAPPDRTRYLEVQDVPHLGLVDDPQYVEAVMATFGIPPERRLPTMMAHEASAPRAAAPHR